MYVQTGSLIDGKFEVLATIGSGGMGVVYETLQQGIERKVALKLLTCLSSSNAEEIARFEREAFILSKLSHKNIVQFYSYGVWGNAPYIAMEQLSGASLQEQLRSNEPLDLEYSFKLVATLCGALEHAHMQNIFHRDSKPSNRL